MDIDEPHVQPSAGSSLLDPCRPSSTHPEDDDLQPPPAGSPPSQNSNEQLTPLTTTTPPSTSTQHGTSQAAGGSQDSPASPSADQDSSIGASASDTSDVPDDTQIGQLHFLHTQFPPRLLSNPRHCVFLVAKYFRLFPSQPGCTGNIHDALSIAWIGTSKVSRCTSLLKQRPSRNQ